MCVDQATAEVASLAKPNVTDRHYIGSSCVARDTTDPQRCCYSRPTVCLCYFAFGNDTQRSYDGAEILGNRETCDVFGRGTSCLFRSCEFKGCDPATPTSCDDVCADVASRIAADNAASFDVALRTAYCEKPSCLCRNTYRLAERCYASFGPTPTSYDCALSDQAIVAADNPPLREDSSEPAVQRDEDAAVPACD